MDRKLQTAIEDIEDALLQGRRLNIQLLFEEDEEWMVNAVVMEAGVLSTSPQQLVYSETDFDTVEDALIGIAENL